MNRATERPVYIIWPQQGWFTADWVTSFAADSYANNADFHRCCTCGEPCLTEGPCDHVGDSIPEYADMRARPTTLEDAIEWLSETGEVTFGEPPSRELYGASDDTWDDDRGEAAR